MRHQDTYQKVSDDKGQDFYCPLEAIGRDNRLKSEMTDDCIETDVVQRYSGHIRVVRS